MTEKSKPSGERRASMSPEAVASEVQMMVRQIGNGVAPDVPTNERFRRVALFIGPSVNAGQVKRLFYAEWREIPAHVFLAVRNAYGRHVERARARAEHDAAVFRALQNDWDTKWGDCSSSACEPVSHDGRPTA